jgi:hypothetical protein
MRYAHGMARVLLLVLFALSTVASADTPKAAAGKLPEWTKLPVDKYRCTRYAPGIGPDDSLRVFAPPGKPMIFTIAARSRDRSKVTYRADGLPPGATLDAKGKFNWNIPKDATGSTSITLYAESASGAATYSFAIAIADPDLVLAWRYGMGGFEPDCQHRIMSFEFSDVDADGQRDLVYVEGDEKDDSPGTGKHTRHVMRRLGAKLDGIDRVVPNGTLEAVTLPDAKPAMLTESSCCCIDEAHIWRITATGVDTIVSASGGGSCSGSGIEIEKNAKGQVNRIVERSGSEEGTPTAWVWKHGAFERE